MSDAYRHTVAVNDRHITITDGRRFVAGNVNVDTLTASFDDAWGGCEISVIFSAKDISVRTTYADGMTVPHEVLANAGYLYVTFVGVREGNVVIETAMQSKPFIIDKEGVVDGADPEPPTPSEYQQLMAEISRIRQDIEAGLLRGEPGEPGKDGYTPIKGVDYFDGAPGAPGSDASATDVRINGQSIVVDGVADIPMAGIGIDGAVRLTDTAYGVTKLENGSLAIQRATESDISARVNRYRPITPSNLDYSLKAAMCDTKGQSWSETERMNARKRMGVDELERDIHFLKLVSEGQLYDYETDESEAYSKQVPKGAMQNAELQMVGGKTVVWNQFFPNVDVVSTNITVAPQAGVRIVNGRKYLMLWTNNGENASHIYTYTRIDGTNTIIGGVPKYTNGLCSHMFTSDLDAVSSGSSSTGQNGILWFFISISGDTTVERPQFFDLTQMFGAGNEPSTVEEFRAMFPADYYPYNPGELISAEVVEVESRGKNLVDVVEFGSWYVDTDERVAHYSPGTNARLSNPGSIEVEPRTDYVFSGTGSGGSPLLVFIDAYKKPISTLRPSLTIQNGMHFFNVSTPSNCRFIGFTYYTLTSGDFQLERGTTATAYKPYVGTVGTFDIPQSIRDLCPGYGWSAGSVYNYIDFENKKYVQRVGSVDMGTLNWSYNGSRFACNLQNKIERNARDTLLNAKYNSFYGSVSNAPDKSIVDGALNSGGSIYVKDADYTTINSFKLASSGVMLYYELATPIEVDLSGVLTETPLMVEAGGSLTFKNSLGDDYHIPVPNREKYVIKANEAV